MMPLLSLGFLWLRLAGDEMSRQKRVIQDTFMPQHAIPILPGSHKCARKCSSKSIQESEYGLEILIFDLPLDFPFLYIYRVYLKFNLCLV